MELDEPYTVLLVGSGAVPIVLAVVVEQIEVLVLTIGALCAIGRKKSIVHVIDVLDGETKLVELHHIAVYVRIDLQAEVHVVALSPDRIGIGAAIDVSLSSDRAWSGRRSAQLHWYGEPLQTS